MQKVVGSSPIIRLEKPAQAGSLLLSGTDMSPSSRKYGSEVGAHRATIRRYLRDDAVERGPPSEALDSVDACFVR